MIFDWEKEFDKETLCDGLDLEDDVIDLDVGYDLIYGWVEDNFVTIGLTDDFKIESLECKCGKDKCPHMAAVLYASNSFKKDVEWEYFLDDLDDDKLINFLKDQIMYNDDVLDDFKNKFRNDIISKGNMYPELKLYIIFEDIFWEDNLIKFIDDDLMKSYEKDKRETFYLVTSMFSNLIDGYDLEERKKLANSWKTVEKLIIKLYDDLPELIYTFLTDCIERNYDSYPSFRKLNKFYLKIKKNHKN